MDPRFWARFAQPLDCISGGPELGGDTIDSGNPSGIIQEAAHVSLWSVKRRYQPYHVRRVRAITCRKKKDGTAPDGEMHTSRWVIAAGGALSCDAMRTTRAEHG